MDGKDEKTEKSETIEKTEKTGKKEKRRKPLPGVILLIVLILLIPAMILLYLDRERPEPAAATPAPTPVPTPTPRVVVETVEKVVEVQAEITAEEIRAGLKDMGKLTTAEYWFTGIASTTVEPKSLLGIELSFTGSSYHASYDGCVTAGIDFGKIAVYRQEGTHLIEVTLPPAEIQSAHIDLATFHLLLEESSIFSRVTPEEFNTSQVELETRARQQAVERGLLERADETARQLVEQFIHGLMGPGYTVRFETSK